MKTLLFLVSSVFALSLCSCKSIGYHVDGKTTILRSDTVHITVLGDKPLQINQLIH